jgi:hypothetical protein
MYFIWDDDEKIRMPLDTIRFLHRKRVIYDIELERIDFIWKKRNDIVHGLQNHEKVINEQMINELDNLKMKQLKIKR